MDGSKQHCTCGVENIKAMVEQLTKLWYTKASGLSTQSGVIRDLLALAGLETQSAAALDWRAQLQVERLLIWQANDFLETCRREPLRRWMRIRTPTYVSVATSRSSLGCQPSLKVASPTATSTGDFTHVRIRF